MKREGVVMILVSQQNYLVRNKTFKSAADAADQPVQILRNCNSYTLFLSTVVSFRQVIDDSSKRLSFLQFVASNSVICFCLGLHKSCISFNGSRTNSPFSYFSYSEFSIVILYHHHHNRYIAVQDLKDTVQLFVV